VERKDSFPRFSGSVYYTNKNFLYMESLGFTQGFFFHCRRSAFFTIIGRTDLFGPADAFGTHALLVAVFTDIEGRNTRGALV
jgi:hypothetical protein